MAKEKIVKYPRGTHINLGIVIFVVILFYVLYHLFAYLTAKRIAVYEVEYGTIAENNTYQGLLLRDEDVFTADFSGEVNYYLKDASKAGVQTLVYSLDESGGIAELIEETARENAELDEESRYAVADTIADFQNSYDSNAFFRVYDFKETVESEIMEAINLSALETVRQSAAFAGGSALFHVVTAAEPGVVVYYTDGYEDVTVVTFTPEQMNELNYAKNNLKAETKVSAGNPVYKVLTNEDWNIVIPVDETVYQSLLNKSTVQIRFLSDNETSYAGVSFRDIGGTHYLILSLNNSMIRYANDRFAEIELITPDHMGLKIPKSAITKKEFFVVPKQYFTQGADSTDLGVLLLDPEAEGELDPQFHATELYYETEDSYYIEEDWVTEGSVIADPAGGGYFTIHDKASLAGVYNVNKGYAVFKQIDVLYENEEYAIVRTGTTYGISLYDHIALEGDKVTEGELVN